MQLSEPMLVHMYIMLCVCHGTAVVAILLAQKQLRAPLSFICIVVYMYKEDDMQSI